MRRRLVAFVAALLIMVGLSALQQAFNSVSVSPGVSVVSTTTDNGGGEVQGGTGQGDEKDPVSSGQAENAPPKDEADPTPAPEPEPEPEPVSTPDPKVDLGPDIELGEGITDARAEQAAAAANVTIRKDGTYTSKVEVALYIHTYGKVPSNYISKTKARNAGWVNTEGNLWDVLPGMSIGGGGYTNEQWGDEPLLPETPEGRDWRECDINYEGGYRGAERLVYSDDGLVFYTGDHYTTFERLY